MYISEKYDSITLKQLKSLKNVKFYVSTKRDFQTRKNTLFFAPFENWLD